MNKLKITILSLLFTLSLGQVSMAQQDPQFTMYMFNMLSVNPAYAGTRDALSLNLINRNQWIGYPGAPVTQAFSAHLPVFNNSIGAGMNVINDKIGPFRNTGAYLNFSYRLKLKSSNLSFGVKAGGDIARIDLSSLYVGTQSDPSFGSSQSSGLLPNFGTGIYYYNDNFYLGASVPRALTNKLWDIKNTNGTRTAKEQMHYYTMGGCVFSITEKIKFKPSFQGKFTAGAPFQLDVNGSVILNEKLYLGAFYRLKDAIGFIVQMNFTDQLRAALAWDQTVSKLTRYNNGSLELSVSYDFIFKKSNIKSPRYF